MAHIYCLSGLLGSRCFSPRHCLAKLNKNQVSYVVLVKRWGYNVDVEKCFKDNNKELDSLYETLYSIKNVNLASAMWKAVTFDGRTFAEFGECMYFCKRYNICIRNNKKNWLFFPIPELLLIDILSYKNMEQIRNHLRHQLPWHHLLQQQ